MQRIRFFGNDIYNFLKSFDDILVTKIFGLLKTLDEVGVFMDQSKLKKVTREIYELRVVSKVSIRIFLTFYNNEVIILHAFVKKSQKIPKKELDLAVHRLQYLQ